MKTNQQVAQIWANNQGQSANAVNMFTVDNTVYSYGYHFPIASIWADCVVFNPMGYSNSTAKHKALVSQQLPIGSLPVVYGVPGNYNKTMIWYANQIDNLKDKLKRARKPERYTNEINRLIENRSRYVRFCGQVVETV